jgi:dihydrofolate reductase
MIVSIIAAVADNGVIGLNNSLPWHLPADFKYFKEVTMGKSIVMGLKTFRSIGEKPLPGRKNIILNDDAGYKAPEGCFAVSSIKDLLEMEKDGKEIMICGGASVYKQFLPLAQRLYLTFVHHNFEGDTFFPDFDKNEWQEIKRINNKADEINKFDYSFVVYERRNKL